MVKTTEDYALSQTGEHLYVSDLRRAAGVSERTLEHAFKEIMGLPPVAYLIRLRLHRVRRVLLAATQGSTTVSAAALDWGFWHFGGFSRAYKDCFGELPSDTLHWRTEPPSGQRVRGIAGRLKKNPGSVSRWVTTAAERRSSESGFARRLGKLDDVHRGEGSPRDS
jgi:AraC-like DNA-binding protein